MVPILLALALPVALAQEAPGSCLRVVVDGVHSDQGVLVVALFNREQAYLDNGPEVALVRVPAAQGRVETRICGLAPGGYVLSTFHDEDNDSNLDMKFGIPLEGFAFSRNPPLLAGKPRFDDILFQVAGPQVDQGVRLRYLL